MIPCSQIQKEKVERRSPGACEGERNGELTINRHRVSVGEVERDSEDGW